MESSATLKVAPVHFDGQVMQIYHLAFLIAFAAAPAAAADQKLVLSPLQIQQMQMRTFEAPYEVVFPSVVSVLQDSGFRLEAADKVSGFVSGTASTPAKSSWGSYKKQTPVASVFIEKISEKSASVRINFVTVKEKNNGYGGVRRDELPVMDIAVYSDAFEKISQAIFVRQSIRSSTQSQTIPQ